MFERSLEQAREPASEARPNGLSVPLSPREAVDTVEAYVRNTETPHDSHDTPNVQGPAGGWRIALQRRLAALPGWLSANTFVPGWLPARWRHERAGYLIAALAQVLGTLTTLLLADRFPSVPHYAVLDALDLLTICLIALSWGAGPSLVATFVGASLLELVGLLPQHIWTSRRSGDLFDVGLFVAVGLIVTVAASRTERARRNAAENYQRARERATALHEANERMDAFLSLVTHELKTPLTAMGLATGLARRRAMRLAQGWTDETATPFAPAGRTAQQVATVQTIGQHLDDIERQIRLQTRLIDDLLDVARIQSEQLELRMAPCDLAQIVRQAVADQRLVCPERVIQLQGCAGSAEAGVVPIFADADRIGQVVTNYLTNALKYSPPDQPVFVSLEHDETRARVAVRDEGPGLSPKEQLRIWQRFYRVEGVRVQSGRGIGLGLGLYICRSIIERHGGAVGVESKLGCGSTFFFHLPLPRKGSLSGLERQ
jgi:signal transduction histidine kinase